MLSHHKQHQIMNAPLPPPPCHMSAFSPLTLVNVCSKANLLDASVELKPAMHRFAANTAHLERFIRIFLLPPMYVTTCVTTYVTSMTLLHIAWIWTGRCGVQLSEGMKVVRQALSDLPVPSAGCV